MSEEVMTVDAKTGGKKGSKMARYDLIPPGPLHTLATHYGKGAEKYEDRNWEKGYDWGLSFAALNRHLWAFWNGEYYDEETGMPHLAAVAFHAFALMEFHEKGLGTDSRSVPPFFAMEREGAGPLFPLTQELLEDADTDRDWFRHLSVQFNTNPWHRLDMVVHDGDAVDVRPDGYFVEHENGSVDWHEWQDDGGEG